MGVVREIIELFKKGYSPKELVKKGYAKSTVYTAWKKYQKTKETHVDEEIKDILNAKLKEGECVKLVENYVICKVNGEIKVLKLTNI